MSATDNNCVFSSSDDEIRYRADDAESAPSTELGSEGSESECSEVEDCDDDSAVAFSLEHTLLIFDWDDTLLPSTWLEDRGFRLDNDAVQTAEQKALLQMMSQRVMETLRVAKRYGTVVLVTNAESGWIELSCQKYMPELYPSLADVKILSARSTYEHRGVLSPSEWKYCAFHYEIGAFYETSPFDQRKHVISFGDSPHERAALIRVTETMSNCCTKSLKFIGRPTVEQLVKEHDVISGCFRDIINHDGDLDFCITCS